MGAYDFPEYEWGTAPSPILYEDKVIVQCDQQNGSFLEASTGRRGGRFGEPSATNCPPGALGGLSGAARTELVTNGWNFVRGDRGERAQAGSPIFAMRARASGDIPGDARRVAWQKRQRGPYMPRGFSGSPIASDGKIYLPSEDGDVFVIKAGTYFELLQKNEMGEPLMATPAISGGMLPVRTQHYLWAICSKGTF